MLGRATRLGRRAIAGLCLAVLLVFAMTLLPVPVQAAAAFNAPLTGVLTGGAGGAQANFPFVGNGGMVSVVMRYSNGNPSTDSGVGFIVFQDTNVVVNLPASQGNAYALATVNGLNYDVQAYNYVPGFTTIFHLVLADPAQGPVPVRTPPGQLLRDHPIRQQLTGQGSGGLDNYTLIGDGQPVTLVLDARPRDPIPDGGIGLAVWDPWGNQLQNLNFQHAIAPSGAVVWTFVPAAGASYVVQAFNYQPGLNITYVLAAL
jgi:hypothetical protein